MRGKYIVISAVFTIILFFLLIYVEKKVTGYDIKTQALVVKQGVNIDKNSKLDKSNFEVKEVPAFLAVNAVSKLDEVDSKYALDNLLSGEILRKEKVGGKNQTQIIEIEPDKRKLAIPVGSLADGVAGQIRKNSYVDILYTNSPSTEEPIVKTETILENVKVLGVTDSNGVLLDESNGGQISSALLAVAPQEAHVLVNKERKGKFRLIGVPENAQPYDKVVVR